MSTPSPVIHIVDDDELVRTALGNLLSAAGFEVRIYSSATEFLLSAPKDNFGARELDVYKGVVAGLLNKQIAADLGTSERTVKMHRAQVMEKMQAKSLTELVQIAGLLEFPTNKR